MGAMCAGGLGSAVREPCAEPVTGGDDEYAGTQRRKAATQEGGREGQGRRADQSREERAGANAPGNANEPTEGPVPGAETTCQRRERDAEKGSHRRQITWNRFSQTRTKRQKPQQSHTRTRSRRDRTESCKGSMSRWCVRHQAALQVGLEVGASGSARRVVPFPDAP